jgi:uncharacterized phiE125 gp8 family phage protein
LDDVREFVQVTHTADDGYLDALIRASRAVVEAYTGRALIQRTVAVDLDANEAQSPLELPLGKLQSVSSFVYYDSDGNSTAITTSDYYIAATNPGRLVAKNAGWSVQRNWKSITVTYVVGYGSTRPTVPDDILHAMKLIVADLWENKTSDAPAGSVYPIPKLAGLLLAPYRLITPYA